MEQKVHTCTLLLDWDLLNKTNKVVYFDAQWQFIVHREGQSLAPLKELTITKSVAASARIKGAYINDEGIEELLKQKNKYIIQDNYSQEAMGYYELLKEIVEKYQEIKLSDTCLKKFHTTLLKYNESEHWKRGDYRQGSHATRTVADVNATKEGFKTVRPTFEIEQLMRELFMWYEQDKQTPTLIKAMVFSYEFLAIKPFDKGSGRLSRLCLVLLIAQSGYGWIQYASLEQEVELRKTEYERIFRNCHSSSDNNVSAWVLFFLEVLSDLQSQLTQKLKKSGTVSSLAQKHKAILLFIETHPGCRSGTISEGLNIANSTTKRLLKELGDQDLIKRYGSGAGTNYTVN